MINNRSVLFALLLVSQISYANDGNDLLKKCSYAINYFETKMLSHEAESGICMGFVAGVRDTLTILTQDHPSIKVCFPEENIDTEKSVRIVYKYLKSNPNALSKNDTLLVIKAFKESYPCR